MDKTKAGTAAALSIIGTWYPKNDKREIDKEELSKWISRGAKPTPSVKKLIEN